MTAGSRAVIEVLGAPAVGKSGLAGELGRMPGVTVLKHHRLDDLPALGWSLVRAGPVLLAPPPTGVGRSRWVAWAGRLGAAPSVVRRRLGGGSTAVVLDQGPAYTLGRMAELRRSAVGAAWWWSQAGDCADLLDLLVVLEADPRVLSRRLRERAKEHPATVLDGERMQAYLHREQLTCRLVADVLGDSGTAVLHLDTTRTPMSDQVAAVATRLGRPAPLPRNT